MANQEAVTGVLSITQEAATDAKSIVQFMQEMNFKLDLIPPLTEGVSAINTQLEVMKRNIEGYDQTVKKVAAEMAVMKRQLADSYRKNDSFEVELKRSNIILYNLQPMDPPRATLKEEVLTYLNWRLPFLSLNRSDIKDVFRFRSGPVLLKLNAVDTRDIILKSGAQLKKDGVSVAPDYTTAQRESRNHLKLVMNRALEERRDVKLRGTKLFIDGRLFMYDEEESRVREFKNDVRVPLRRQPRPQVNVQVEARNVNEGSAMDVPTVESDVDEDSNTITEEVDEQPMPEIPASTSCVGVSTSSAASSYSSVAQASMNKRGRKIGEIISPQDQNQNGYRNVRNQRYYSRGARGERAGIARPAPHDRQSEFDQLSFGHENSTGETSPFKLN